MTTTNLQHLFNQLVDERSIKLIGLTKQEAESLRVMLSKKWNLNKKRLDDLGFLDSSTKNTILSMTKLKNDAPDIVTETDIGYSYELKTREKTEKMYTIMTIVKTESPLGPSSQHD